MDTVTATTAPSIARVHRLRVEDIARYDILHDAFISFMTLVHSVEEHNPLNNVTQKEAKRFHKKYRIPVERDVFIRGVLALRSQVDIKAAFEDVQSARLEHPNGPHSRIELRVGEEKYTRLESEILYKAFLPQGRMETLRSLSRLHRLLIIACIFAAMTQ